MTFTRPKDIKLVDMAIWVDKISTQNDYDENKLIEYLYHLVYSRAVQAVSFQDKETYDDFSIYCVSKLLTRLKNQEDEKVKSIVNYIKIVVPHWHAEYVKAFCTGSSEVEIADFDVTDFSEYLIDLTRLNDYNNFLIDDCKVCLIIKKYMRKLPVKIHSPEWCNIYISCLLTLNNMITSATVLSKKLYSSDDPMLLGRVIRSLKKKPPILFHIDENMSNYVSVLVNEIIHEISVELCYATSSQVDPTSCIKNLVIAANNDEDI